MLSAALSLAIGGAAAASDFTPAFFWSGREIGVGRNAEHLHSTTSTDLERAIDLITGKQVGGHQPNHLVPIGGHPAPEVQLIFLADELSTEAARQHGAGLKNLQHLLETSASSLSVPFTTRSEELPRIFDSATRLAASDAEKYLTEHATLYHNGVPDVVVVELKPEAASTKDALVSVDGHIGRLSHVVARGTAGNYAAMLTGLQQIAAGDAMEGSHGRILSVDKNDEKLPYLHMTPALLTAYMVGLLLFIIFISGFLCLFGLQTPKKFDDAKSA